MSKLCGYIGKGNVVARFSSIEAFIIIAKLQGRELATAWNLRP